MFVFGRLSSTSVCPVLHVAEAFPALDPCSVHVNALLMTSGFGALFDFVSVRSGAVTVTVSVAVLLPSLLSTMLLFGSTVAEPRLRGFANVPMVVGVAVKVTSNEPPAPIVTGMLLAVHVRSFVVMLQLMFPLLVMPAKLPAVAAPYP